MQAPCFRHGLHARTIPTYPCQDLRCKPVNKDRVILATSFLKRQPINVVYKATIPAEGWCVCLLPICRFGVSFRAHAESETIEEVYPPALLPLQFSAPPLLNLFLFHYCSGFRLCQRTMYVLTDFNKPLSQSDGPKPLIEKRPSVSCALSATSTPKNRRTSLKCLSIPKSKR